MEVKVPQPAVRIAVYDPRGALVPDADVTITHAATHSSTRLERDDQGGYETAVAAPGRYTVSVSAKGFEAQQRSVDVHETGAQEIFVIGPPNAPYLYRGVAKVPYEPPNLLAITAPAGLDPKRFGETVGALAAEYRLEPRELPPGLAGRNAALFALPAAFADDAHVNFRARVAEQLGEVHVGEVVRIDDESMIFASNELIAKFKPEVTREQIAELARGLGLEIVRWIPNIGNAVLLRARGPATARVFSHADKLLETGLLEYAEPNLVSTVVYDSITPTDYLYPLQWHLPTAQLNDAWQALNDGLDPTRKYGDPGIIVGVFDEGVDPTNPEFTTTVSDGTAKYFAAYDFDHMVANNDFVTGNAAVNHGTRCAGIAAASTDDPSSVAGVTEGVAGAAGNCRILGVRVPWSGAELQFSDMYIWAAGFDPHSATAGFPAPLARGVDVLTNSIGVFPGMPISGLMRDTFDFCTGYGRGGRGCVFCFSIANVTPPVDFTLLRPWAAYVKNNACAASSLGPDGVTEIHADYSNYSGPTSTISCCAPSHDSYVGGEPFFNPPQHYATVTADVAGTGNLPAPPLTTTTLTAGAGAGDTALSVASTAGFTAGTWILVGTPALIGSESVQVTGITDGTHLAVTALLHPYMSGTPVIGGPNDFAKNHGGTSSATPLVAGIAALILSANPSMTWIDVRTAIRSTAVKIDPANTDPIGRWTDAMGRISTDPMYSGPVYSRWYGFGRINAAAAVQHALTFTAQTVLVRDELSDTGAVPSTGQFWDSPDIWVRNTDPASDPGAIPATYGDAGPTQEVQHSSTNYVYVRLKNIGGATSEQGYVRIYVSHFAGTEFVYPNDFIPTNHPGQPVPVPMTPGTYLIAEIPYNPIAAGTSVVLHAPWPSALIPPQTAMVGMSTVTWHPCLLAEVSPHPGPSLAGVHVWDSPNLAQKNITINYADSGGDAEQTIMSAIVLGNLHNPSDFVIATLDTSDLPDGMRAFVHLADTRANANLRRFVHDGSFTVVPPSQLVFHDEARFSVLEGAFEAVEEAVEEVVELAEPAIRVLRPKTKVALGGKTVTYDPAAWRFTLGTHAGMPVAWLGVRAVARVPIFAGRGGLVPLVVGGVVARGTPKGTHDLVVLQEQPNGERSGAAAVRLVVK
ncbi:MAG TPA: S8 family serine peptidase [Candidatus Limnocylindrales bacterium]|nr:S8 family serine peptidase [Candidatus Limnocylindrales bacterium]